MKSKMIVRCADADEAKAVEKTLNEELSIATACTSVKDNEVVLDENPYGKKTIKRIRKAAKSIRNLRRSLESHMNRS